MTLKCAENLSLGTLAQVRKYFSSCVLDFDHSDPDSESAERFDPEHEHGDGGGNAYETGPQAGANVGARPEQRQLLRQGRRAYLQLFLDKGGQLTVRRRISHEKGRPVEGIGQGVRPAVDCPAVA
jgi:hypothetical protein